MIPFLATLLVAAMTWPGAAQSGDATSTTASVAATTAPPTTAAPSTTAAPPTTATTTTSTTAPSTSSTTTGAPTTTTSTTAPGAPSTDTVPATDTTLVDQAERQRLEQEALAKAREVDAANARLGDLSGALGVLNQRVAAQSARVDYANAQVAAAETHATASAQAVLDAEVALVELERRVRSQAIQAFMGDDTEQTAVLVTGDPYRSIRMSAMLAEITQSDLDLAETLDKAREDLDVQRVEAENAIAAAEALQVQAAQELESLQVDRDAQRQLTFAAESRLDHLLSERAALAALGADGGDLSPDEAALVAQLQNTGPPDGPDGNVVIPDVVDESQIRLAGNGIRVHFTIVEDVQALLTAAAAAGYDLAGGGYRDSASQIAIRRANCGTSNYAIYEMPASRCSPPTARPGASMHERGLAIDFTYRGQLIRSRSNAAFVWLSQNAARYGLYNLPSEPWHWSTNGN